ncbi:MAG: Lrp/AsnC family transcriptional regulator [Bacteroidota bacterium]
MIQLDQTDRRILRALQADAKLTNVHLAQEIGLSPASTLERVRKLEHRGLIQSYHAKLAPERLGLHTLVWVQVQLHDLKSTTVEAFRKAIAQVSEITECYQGVGGGDFCFKVVTTSLEAYQGLLTQHLYPTGVIKDLQAFVITATLKDTGVAVQEKTSQLNYAATAN